MPIQPMSFPILSFQQANPFAAGLSAGNDLVEGYFKNKVEQQKAKYAERDIMAELLKKELANQSATIKNKYLEPREKAALAYEQLQPDYLRAQTGKVNLENQYYGRKSEAEIAQALASALLNREQAKYYAPNIQSEIDYRKAQTDTQRFKAQNPLLGEPGATGMIGAEIFLRNHPELNQGGAVSPQGSAPQIPFRGEPPSAQEPGNAQGKAPFADVLHNALMGELGRKDAVTNYLNKRTQGFEWTALTQPERADYLATTRALGYEPKQAINAYNQGKTIGELAQAHGFDPNNLPEKQYPAGNPLINQVQRANMVNSGLKAVEEDIANDIAPYSRRFANGISPSLIKDLAISTNEDKLAAALGAFALQPEIAFARARIAGGQPGVTVMEEMMKKAHGTVKTLGMSPNSKIYKKMQKYIANKIEAIRQGENQYAFGTQRGIQEENSGASHEDDVMGLLNEAGS